MLKAFGIAALMAGALSILPSVAQAEPYGIRRAEIVRHERIDRERHWEHVRMERERRAEALRRASWHRHHAWRG